MSLLADAPEPSKKRLGPPCWYELVAEQLDAKDMARLDEWLAGEAKHTDLADHLTTHLAPLFPLGGRTRISANAVGSHRARGCRCGQA